MKLTAKEAKKALESLNKRRTENLNRESVNNALLHAGSPMHFDCTGCGADITVPESYVTKPELCDDCQILKNNGLLTSWKKRS